MADEVEAAQLTDKAWLESLGVEFRGEPNPDLAAELARPAGAASIPVASFGQFATMVGGFDPLVSEGFVVAVIGAFGDHKEFHYSRDSAMAHFHLFRQPPLPSACYLMSALLIGGPQGVLWLVGEVELKETEGAVTGADDLRQPWPPSVAAAVTALGLTGRSR